MDKALDDDEDDNDDDDLFRPGSKQSETRPKGKVSLHLFIKTPSAVFVNISGYIAQTKRVSFRTVSSL